MYTHTTTQPHTRTHTHPHKHKHTTAHTYLGEGVHQRVAGGNALKTGEGKIKALDQNKPEVVTVVVWAVAAPLYLRVPAKAMERGE